MESQSTLVGPSGSQPHLILVFSHDSILNTTLTRVDPSYPAGASIGNGKIVYQLKTDAKASATKTDFLRGDGSKFATYDRRIFGGRMIVRPGEEKVRMTKWLQSTAKLADFISQGGFEMSVDPLTFTSLGELYLWNVNLVGQLAVFRHGAELTDPLAWFNVSKQRMVDGVLVKFPATISFSEHVGEGRLRDDILITWMLVAEKTRARALQVSANTLIESTGKI